ncbi:MAG: phosphatidate cytidylyltransferase [Alistipes sp.]
MGKKMKDLTVRTGTGFVLLLVVFGSIFLSKWSFGALLLVILIGSLREFYRMARRGGIAPQRTFGMVTGALFFIVNFIVFLYLEKETGGQAMFIALAGMLLVLLLAIPLMFVVALNHRCKNPIADLGATFVGLLYIAMPMSLLLYIPILADQNMVWNPWVMLLYMMLIWANDVCAYLVGVSFGRHHICERISPKKSWEGFFGGIIGALAMGLLSAYILGGNLAIWLGLALVVAITGVLGDLVESMFKRSAGVKDSGRIMPGHGGWLDRFDALILSAPFAFVYLVFATLFLGKL